MSRPIYPRGKSPGLVGPRTGLEDKEKTKLLKLPGLEYRSLGHPACHYTECTQIMQRSITRSRITYLNYIIVAYFKVLQSWSVELKENKIK
jgi:hypothetical protein